GFALVLQFDLDRELLARLGFGRAGDAVAHQLPGRGKFKIFGAEQLVDRVGGDFGAGFVRYPLNGPAELDLQAARQHQAVLLFEQVRDAALARLAVDAYDGVVAAAQVGRVDGQVGHFPERVGLLLGEAFLDGVLVRAREGREDQVAGVGMARVHGQLVAVLDAAPHFVDIGEVEAGVYALGIQIEGQGDKIDVAGALAVAEQAAFDAVGAGHDGELG